jgi:hypothetical protein
MIYPYTIVKSKDIDFIYSFLRKLGFSFTGGSKNYYKEFDCVYCIVDDMRTFGNFCFYIGKNQMDPNRIRKFISNNQEFLCEVYKLAGYDEL